MLFYRFVCGLLHDGLLRHYFIYLNPFAVAVGNHAFPDVQVLSYVSGFGCLTDKSEAVVDVLEYLLYFRFGVLPAYGKDLPAFLNDWCLAAKAAISGFGFGTVKVKAGQSIVTQRAVPFVITLVDERVLEDEAVVLWIGVTEV